MTLWKWSRTAASNSNADSTINYAEGQSAGSVNDSGRAGMAAVAKYRDDTSGVVATTGSADTYSFTSYQSLTSLTDGYKITFTCNATNTGASTIAVDGLTAKPLRSVPSTALAAGALVSGCIYTATYDSSGDEWLLHRAPGGAVQTSDLANDSVTYAKIQNVSATDKVLGRSTSGAGDVEEITMTAAGRALMDDAAASDQRTTLGLGTAALKNTGTSGDAVALLDQANTWTLAQKAPNTAKAFATFSVSGTTVSFTAATQGYNVASITRTGEGVFTVAFTAALPTANYVVVGSGRRETANDTIAVIASSKLTTGFTLTTMLTSSLTESDPGPCDFIVMGF